MSESQANLELKIKEQKVLKVELETLKPHKTVYVQQPNSFVFFKSDIKTTLTNCKIKLNELDKERSLDNSIN